MFSHSHIQNITDRFVRYAKIDTQSDPYSNTYPSTEKQKNLSQVLHQELLEAGIADCELNEFGYIYATLPATSPKLNIPVLCFCAHVDTAPDCSGTNVKPIIHKNYQGQEIILPDDPSVVISPQDFPLLKEKIGEDIITASGLTLLGSDDKSGVSAIMEAAIFLIQHPEIQHGKIRILFTTDEEIGRGVDKVNIAKLGADYGYTFDSGELGSMEDETFSADSVIIEIKGVSTHPGYAKGKMEHASKIVAEILAALPKEHLIPEATSGRQGFIHPTKIEGSLETAKLEFIIRDFDTSKLKEYEDFLESLTKRILRNYPNSTYTFAVHEQYRNMKEILIHHPNVVQYAEEAMKESNIRVKKGIIRGGTDGSRLSFMGLPCPNIFAGEQAIHSRKEWTSVQDMLKASEVLIRICQQWERHA